MRTELGERIKLLRLARNLTLKEVGEKAKVSATHLSEIERGKTSPTVGALARIARALGQEPAQLVTDDEAPPVSVVRHAGRRTWTSGFAVLSSLSRAIHPAELSLLEIEVPVGSRGPVDAPAETGEVLIIVLEGRVDFDLRGNVRILRAGDALHFDARDPHGLFASGERARLLWVTRPPLWM